MRNLRRAALVAALTLLAGCGDEIVAPKADPTAATGARPATIGYVLTPNGNVRPVSFEVRDGMAISEGDIILGPAAEIARTPEEALRRARPGGGDGARLGSAVSGASYRWPGGRVPYVIDGSISNPQLVRDAMAHIEYWTGRVADGTSSRYVGARIDFVARTTETDYIRISKGSGCSSYVGRIGGGQPVSLGAGCLYASIAIHELTHAIGMAHEQNRCDRDSFVAIYWANINDAQEYNFHKGCAGDGYSLVAEYDEGSIMHYGPYDFSINGSATIGSRRGLASMMGAYDYIRWNDIYAVQWMYGYNYGQAATGGPSNVRSGPGSGYPVVRTVAAGATLKITCQRAGTTESGPWGATDVWNRLPSGEWISDAVVYTGTTYKYVSARC